MGAHLGELYSVGTALCWVGTAVLFTKAGERMGSMVVNLLRMVMGLVILTVIAWTTRGMPWPTDASEHAWVWLSISGLVGFTFGDLCLFRAFLLLGPRLSTLMMSFAPPLAAVAGWIWLDERLGPWQIGGMCTVLAGVMWAILDRTPSEASEAPRSARRLGVLLGFFGALGQGVGLVLSKYGMGSYEAIAANQIRVFAGMVGFAVMFTVIGWWPRVRRSLKDGPGLAYTAGGAFAGPVLGVTMSLLAVQRIEAGVAASIMGTTPVLIIPYMVWVRKERVGVGGVLGALLAVSGVALLFLAPR
ncbi:MAG: DMT family transporter [Nannocystaceae bacterium]|nr:DMT family transporter [Nannocystaceae bacterium]